MKIRNIIAQLFILGFPGLTLDDSRTIAEDISRRNLGGVILFDRFLAENRDRNNVQSFKQLHKLCSQLQSAAQTKLLISIDQEGGMVRRLKPKHGFQELPAAADMGDQSKDSESRRHARATAELLATLGINLNFAPVADLNCNPNNPVIGKLGRSFSNDPHQVTHHCQIWLEEHQRAGILGCMKHFPGHGSSTKDSHLDFVDISETWKNNELIPYTSIIPANRVHIIMMGHLFHRGFDRKYPASLSHSVINELLRKKLGFNGLVITDDMQMKAITERFGLLDSFVLALNSGIDMIIVGNNIQYNPDILEKAVNHIEKYINRQQLPIERVMQAYARVQRIKEMLP